MHLKATVWWVDREWTDRQTRDKGNVTKHPLENLVVGTWVLTAPIFQSFCMFQNLHGKTLRRKSQTHEPHSPPRGFSSALFLWAGDFPCGNVSACRAKGPGSGLQGLSHPSFHWEGQGMGHGGREQGQADARGHLFTLIVTSLSRVHPCWDWSRQGEESLAHCGSAGEEKGITGDTCACVCWGRWRPCCGLKETLTLGHHKAIPWNP